MIDWEDAAFMSKMARMAFSQWFSPRSDGSHLRATELPGHVGYGIGELVGSHSLPVDGLEGACVGAGEHVDAELIAPSTLQLSISGNQRIRVDKIIE